MTDWTVTLESLRKHSACVEGYNKLVCHLVGTEFNKYSNSYIHSDYQEPIPLLTVLESNGLQDAMWSLRCVEGKGKDIIYYVAWLARQVQHLMRDKRSLDALDVAERFADGKATEEELDIAIKAADAARAAADAAAARAASAVDVVYAACAAARAARAAEYAAEYAAADAAAAATSAAYAAAATSATSVATATATRQAVEVKQAEMFRLMVVGQAPWQLEN